MILGYSSLFVIGLLAAIMGSLIGLGGGFLVVPALLILSEPLLGEAMPATIAVGTSLTMLIFTGLSSTISYIRQRMIDYRTGWLFTLISAPSSILGASLTNVFEGPAFELGFGVFMLLMAILMMVKNRLKPLQVDWAIKRTYVEPDGRTWNYGYNWWSAVLIGLAVGLISGLFGIGGGSLFVPAMVLLYGFPPHIASATSMFVIFWSAIIGSATHIYLGEIDWPSAAFLIPGALVGGWLGARIARRLSSRVLLWVLRFALLFIACRMILSSLMS
jgi:hypothetical protein